MEQTTPTINPNLFVLTKEVRKAFGIKLTPYVRQNPKIQRNSPCPCGSGLKYKKCHMELDKLEENGNNYKSEVL